MDTIDYVVVGALSAGCVVASRLTEHPGVRVLLLEAGGDDEHPDVADPTKWPQPVLIEFPFATPELADPLTPNAYTLAPSVVRTDNRGSESLTTADPAVHPRIYIHHLASRADMDALVAATELCSEVGGAKAFDGLRKRKIMPGKFGRTALEDFVRNGATTYFHPAGSCEMGPDAMAVVDGTLRVHGVQGLRVADASIMPTITSDNTNAPSKTIGERIVDRIRSAH
ncbi:MAG: GMC oxidoreductase [Gemmatimonadaceae bacterium]|nr:GMC oxidoreductase [Gemmatimonadaceae bacterium]